MAEIDLSEFYPVKDIRCVVSKFMDQLTEVEQEQLKAAIQHPNISAPSISQWLARRGFKTTAATVNTHRRKQCRCD